MLFWLLFYVGSTSLYSDRMASIVERRDRQKLCVYYYDAAGKRRGKFFGLTERRKAKKFAAEKDADKRATAAFSLETAATYYLEDRMAVCEAATYERYKSVLVNFCEICGPVALASIDAQRISTWRNARLEVRARTTVRNDFKTLRAFFRWCVVRNWLATDPTVGVDAPRVKRTLPKFLTPTQCDELLAIMAKDAPRELYMIAVFALRAGMRRNEILTLPWASVNFDQGIITVRGKSVEERVIPMHSDIRTALMDWPQDGLYVFPAKYKVENNIRSPNVAKYFNDWLRTHGWNITLHGLRHSFAVRMVTRGASERAVGDLLGHQDVRTTRIYARSFLDHLRTLVEDAAESPAPTVSPSAVSQTPRGRRKAPSAGPTQVA